MSHQPEPLFAVSVVTYRSTADQLHEMLAALLEAIDNLRQQQIENIYGKIEISIVDNSESPFLSSNDFSQYKPLLDATDSEIVLIAGQGNVGYGAGQNLALSNSESTFHLFMNSDVIMHSMALAEGVGFLLRHPDVGIVSPASVDDKGEKQYLCKRFPSLFVLFLRGFMPHFVQSRFRTKLAHYEMQELSSEVPTQDIPIVSGCYMLCRSEAINEAAGFDEEYFLYFEDFDLSMRLRESHTLAHLPAMRIIHHGGNAGKKGFRHVLYFLRSAIRFFNTYGWRLY